MKNIISVLAIVAALGACSLIPEFDKPAVDTPADWKEGAASVEATVNADWWRNFRNAELDALMVRALENNTDIRAAIARVNQARASARIAGASLLPAVDASASVAEGRETPGEWSNTGRVGLDVSYELDLFGLNRANVKAAKARALGSVFDRDAVSLLIMGDVAREFFRLVNLNDRIDIAQRNITNQRNVMRIVQARFEAGASSALDVSRQRAEVATTEATLAALRRQAAISENALSILLGEAPKDFALKTRALSKVKTPPIPPTQPALVVAQRPDIRAAEQELIAANADIGAARAAFFPQINIGAGATALFSPIDNPATRGVELLASLIAPIFHGGELEGGVERATARQVELAEDYRSTVLIAFREVEDALATAKAARARLDSFAIALRESRRTYDLSRQLYEAGSVDYQSMLDTQRTLLAADDSYAVAQLELVQAAVDLYRALGGGWANTEGK
jgi:outer membrane protein, multidrug efflux system